VRVAANAIRKADEGSKHRDRNPPFEYINAKVIAARKPPLPSTHYFLHSQPPIRSGQGTDPDYSDKGSRIR
jgi:hypothetical protein